MVGVHHEPDLALAVLLAREEQAEMTDERTTGSQVRSQVEAVAVAIDRGLQLARLDHLPCLVP